ncbi:MAG: site-2 protease family protein [Verrucomicrobia bacterium]|jgi:Zn-dependent protease|nr:site-2 protease family protein [Verrucomicrobiota bacterium]
MDPKSLIDGLILYLGLLVLLTFHEFGHAWMAWKCGDDTARLQGRVTLNPLAHMDLWGTVILPLAMIFLSPGIGRFLVGWAKPVPVNPANLRNKKLDDILVTLAGPWMNLMLAVLLLGIAKIGMMAGSASTLELCSNMARLSLVLCFFNLIPIPPLDGSQVVRVLTGMSYETYNKIARFGFIIVILVLQIPIVRQLLAVITGTSWRIIAGWMGVGGL